MSNQVKFGKEATEAILRGLDIVADATACTIGPKGRNVFIQGVYENEITNDGVTVANAIELEDKFEDLGSEIIRNVSAKMDEDVGDGTTTAVILTQSIIHECLKRPENPMAIRESLKEAGREAVTLLKEKSIRAKPEDLASVALISTEDAEIASMITELHAKLGDSAVINVEDSKTFESSYEMIAGYDAPVGFLSRHFITDKAAGKAILEDAVVLVSEKKISSFTDIRKIAKEFEDKNITRSVIVCDDIDDSMLGFFAANSVNGVQKSIVIKAHGEILEDIAGATGATAVGDRHGVNFHNINASHLGHVDRAVVDANKSLFLGSSISGAIRAAELEGMAEAEENIYRKQKLKDRAAKLRGGVGVLRIGANSDKERTYLKRKAEDGIKAVQAAKEEGIVEGGGMALWRIASELPRETVGQQILGKSLQAPLRKIIENAGRDYSEVMQYLVDVESGYDAKRDLPVKMVNDGIVDPTKVERMAFLNAISAASQFITSFAAIVDSPEPKK